MKILITGGAGFIGSHLTEKCLKRGDTVFIVDNLTTGSLQNLEHLDKEHSSRLFITIDTILNRELMENLIQEVDVVVHLAAAVGVDYIIANPLSSIHTNVFGTELILNLCSQYRRQVLLASTSEVYGKHDTAPLLETMDCVYGSSDKSRWSYAAGKLMDEFTGLAYHRTLELPVIIVRLFNTVGPRQTGRYGMVIPRFIEQARKNLPMTVYGTGEQTRTFTHVDEVVTSLLKLLETPEAIGNVINIGGTEEVSILEVAKKVRDLSESESEIQLIPYSEAYPRDFEDMQRRVPSTKKLFQLTGYAPTLGLEEILLDILGRKPQKRKTLPARPPLSAKGAPIPVSYPPQ